MEEVSWCVSVVVAAKSLTAARPRSSFAAIVRSPTELPSTRPERTTLTVTEVDRPKGSPKRVVCTVATITGLGGVLSGAVSGAWAAAVELFLARRGRLRSSLPARLDERPFEIKEFSSGVCVRYERFDKAGADSAEDGVRLRFTSGDCKHFRYCQELFGRDGH